MTDSEHAAEPLEVTESDPNGGGPDGLAGGIGVSSERVGPVRGRTEELTHAAEDHQQRPRDSADGPGDSTDHSDHLPS